MSVVEEFSGIDVDDNYVAAEKEETGGCFWTCFCICVRSGLAIGSCCRQWDLVGDVQLHFQYSDHPTTVSVTSLRAGAFAV